MRTKRKKMTRPMTTATHKLPSPDLSGAAPNAANNAIIATKAEATMT